MTDEPPPARYRWWGRSDVPLDRSIRTAGFTSTLEEARHERDRWIRAVQMELGDPPTSGWSAGIIDVEINKELDAERREGRPSTGTHA
jgi:hypothetical protein